MDSRILKIKKRKRVAMTIIKHLIGALKYITLAILALLITQLNHAAPINRSKPKMLLVGAGGKQAQAYFQLLRDQVTFVGFVVRTINEPMATLATTNNIKIVNTIDIALREIDFDVALVSVPHYLHHEITSKLLAHNKAVIKEKPLACNTDDLSFCTNHSHHSSPVLFTIVQRNFQEPFSHAKENLHLIGTPYSFCYNYHMNLKDITTGWRSKQDLAKGGVLLDMGYHVIDMVNVFFGMPTQIQAQFSYCYERMRQEKLEDQAHILFNYDTQKLCGIINISRHYHNREEEFVIEGTDGTLIITPQGYTIYNRNGSLKKEYVSPLTKEDAQLNMLTCYLNNLTNQDFINKHVQHHKNNVALMETIYQNAVGYRS